jgi:hypothetical protein
MSEDSGEIRGGTGRLEASGAAGWKPALRGAALPRRPPYRAALREHMQSQHWLMLELIRRRAVSQRVGFSSRRRRNWFFSTKPVVQTVRVTAVESWGWLDITKVRNRRPDRILLRFRQLGQFGQLLLEYLTHA